MTNLQQLHIVIICNSKFVNGAKLTTDFSLYRNYYNYHCCFVYMYGLTHHLSLYTGIHIAVCGYDHFNSIYLILHCELTYVPRVRQQNIKLLYVDELSEEGNNPKFLILIPNKFSPLPKSLSHNNEVNSLN